MHKPFANIRSGKQTGFLVEQWMTNGFCYETMDDKMVHLYEIGPTTV